MTKTHVVHKPTEPFPIASGALEVHQIPAWEDNFIWLIVCTKTGAAAAVDGPEADPLLTYCKQHGIDLRSIFNTHTHGDHVGLNRDLIRRDLLGPIDVVGSARAAKNVPGLTRGVDEGDTVTVGTVSGRVMLTEGHLNGHITFAFDGAVFCGDTMFAAGCGYLFDGPAPTMHDSLSRIAALDPSTHLCCAHEYTQDNLRFAWTVEPDNDALKNRIQTAWRTRSEGRSCVPSTIGLERQTNPFLRTHSESLRQHVTTAMPSMPSETPAELFAATRALKDTKTYRALGDTHLPLTS